jgi:hypothetical protein
MMKLWWSQVKSIVRLEMRKTFFARRGLWIYILALLPLLLFVAQGFVASHERGRNTEMAAQGEKRLTNDDLRGSDRSARETPTALPLESAKAV